ATMPRRSRRRGMTSGSIITEAGAVPPARERPIPTPATSERPRPAQLLTRDGLKTLKAGCNVFPRPVAADVRSCSAPTFTRKEIMHFSGLGLLSPDSTHQYSPQADPHDAYHLLLETHQRLRPLLPAVPRQENPAQHPHYLDSPRKLISLKIKQRMSKAGAIEQLIPTPRLGPQENRTQCHQDIYTHEQHNDEDNTKKSVAGLCPSSLPDFADAKHTEGIRDKSIANFPSSDLFLAQTTVNPLQSQVMEQRADKAKIDHPMADEKEHHPEDYTDKLIANLPSSLYDFDDPQTGEKEELGTTTHSQSNMATNIHEFSYYSCEFHELYSPDFRERHPGRAYSQYIPYTLFGDSPDIFEDFRRSLGHLYL
ncbi:hypothetical protein GOP47_0018339, partial [Adiantum capillus-veneris]